jgi:hypothetical protein
MKWFRHSARIDLIHLSTKAFVLGCAGRRKMYVGAPVMEVALH